MKERYVKPQLLFESFSLSQTIAKDCGDTHSGTLGESNHYDAETCEWDAGDYTIFFDHCGDEQVPPIEGSGMTEEEYEAMIADIVGLCYNNPDGGQTIFSSL